jgi:hypothetical protein
VRAAAACCALLAACASPPPAPASWQPLFDGATLRGWQITNFGGEGPVEVRDGRIEFGFGSPLTGVTWLAGLPADAYELELSCQKRLGSDFFCGLTFPVGDSHATFVLGGWGGSVVGLSSIDGDDAAHNATRQVRHFVTGRAYRVRVAVSGSAIRCFIDDRCCVDVARAGHTFSLRPEVLPNRPLGVASYLTCAAVWDIRWRPLDR